MFRLHLPHVPLRCCASSFSHAMNVLVRRCRQIPWRVCSQKRYYRSIHPIPIRSTNGEKRGEEHEARESYKKVINSLPIVSHPKRIRTCSPVVARFDGSSRMCTIQLSLRCKHGRSSASPLHLWWRKWRQFHGNLGGNWKNSLVKFDCLRFDTSVEMLTKLDKEALSNDQQLDIHLRSL
jgi:hypothetical protein